MKKVTVKVANGKPFPKDMLKTGTFGIVRECDNEDSCGEPFVICGDKMIYQSGAFDSIDYFENYGKAYVSEIIFLTTKAVSFDHLRDCFAERKKDNKSCWTRRGVKNVRFSN